MGKDGKTNQKVEMRRRLVLLRTMAAALAAGLLALIAPGAEPAETTFSGFSSKIAFVSDRVTPTDTTDDHEIFTMNANGSNVTQLTFNTTGGDGNPD